jgi:hypothetical protein
MFKNETDILKYIYVCFIKGEVDHRLKYGSDGPLKKLVGGDASL